MNDSEKPTLQLIEEIVALRQRLADIEELAHLGSWIWSVSTGAVDWSQKIYHIFGVDQQTFSPNIEAVTAFFHPEDRHLIKSVIDEATKGPGRFTFNARIIRPSGDLRHVISTAMGYFNADGALERISGTVQDVTDQKADEAKLKESERRYALVVDGLNDGLVDWNITSNTVYYSQQWKEMLGLTTVDIGDSHKIWEDRFHPEDAELAWEAVKEYLRGETTELRFEHRLRHEGGLYRWFLARGICVRDEEQKPVRLVVSHSDITEQVEMRTEKDRLQSQLQQSQKLEAIGRLAGGVAHDFNNLLTVIQGYSEMVYDELRDDDPLRREVAQVQKAADSAASLTQQLLAFSRKQLVRPKLIDLNKTVGVAEKMIRRIIGEDIDLAFKAGDDLWQTKIDPGQVEQIIVNLAVNARDAIPSAGSLTIRTENTTLDGPCCHYCLDSVSGDFVRLTVTDTGSGMDLETVGMIFEPFFTTKEVGKGTGLGLSTITGIVHQANGHIKVDSAPGLGTTFTIHLPRATAVDAEPQPAPPAVVTTGGETCLVVEDQMMVRELVVRGLRDLGYTVLDAESGIRALNAAEKFADEIDLLITDIVMPGMNGKQLFERIRKFKPDMRVLYMSGYADDAIARHGVLDLGSGFIQKPFLLQELAQRVRQILDMELPQTG